MSITVADIEGKEWAEGYKAGLRDAVVHAHWIEEEDCMAVTDIPWSMCSVCGSYSLKLQYCAFCGAKMDEVIE